MRKAASTLLDNLDNYKVPLNATSAHLYNEILIQEQSARYQIGEATRIRYTTELQRSHPHLNRS